MSNSSIKGYSHELKYFRHNTHIIYTALDFIVISIFLEYWDNYDSGSGIAPDFRKYPRTFALKIADICA